ncbi:hypothetical protein Pcinc_029433 [Petrolisthes cinctipes]|uniref:Uncharacterized protein n=1 Tax=Petrolisthes cinctipes TaxID=88211 RepID=A0AAE1F028_PETCI|nr:hypothetical protein Pcinc_029433 [Petrolisthes cinctipes]
MRRVDGGMVMKVMKRVYGGNGDQAMKRVDGGNGNEAVHDSGSRPERRLLKTREASDCGDCEAKNGSNDNNQSGHISISSPSKTSIWKREEDTCGRSSSGMESGRWLSCWGVDDW